MTDGIRVSPDSIRNSAANIRQTAASLAAETQRFQSMVSGLVEQPGSDMISPLIWTAHGVVFDVAAKCLASNIKGLGTHAHNLETMARVHDLTEEANVVSVNRVREILG